LDRQFAHAVFGLTDGGERWMSMSGNRDVVYADDERSRGTREP
jgi:hypothetical protein